MTLLEVVNGVLRRLRETAVADTSDTTYSTMIVDFVNDAKTLVENAWDWTALRDTITVTTAASTTNYSLTGSGTRLKVINVLNDTDNFEVLKRTQTQIDKLQTITTTAEGSPNFYIFRGVNASGDLTVDFFPIPDGVYSVDFNVVKPQATLVASTDDATEILVPAEPVLHLALAMAARERGETGGTSAQEHFNIADGFLADAIALDATRQSHELVWYPA